MSDVEQLVGLDAGLHVVHLGCQREASTATRGQRGYEQGVGARLRFAGGWLMTGGPRIAGGWLLIAGGG